MNPSIKRKFSIILPLLLILLASCTPPAATEPDATLVAQEVDAARTQAVQTAMAQLTFEAALQASPTEPEPTTEIEEAPPSPTATERPTATIPPLPTLAPSATPTRIYPTWTPLPKEYQCQITEQIPQYGKYVSLYADLDARWTVKNTGTETWEKSIVDYIYVSGSDIHKFDDRYDLKENVDPGEEIQIIVDISGPGLEGNYTETWGLAIGGDVFCTLPFAINVVE